MQRLQRIDQHAGDVAPLAQHPQRILRHVVQGIGLARRHRIADAGLNVAPPAMVGAAETNKMRAARVIARQPHRLHHRLGAGHVERHFVESGDLPQPLDVVCDRRVIGAEHGAEVADELDPALDALLVEVVAEDVDAIGAGQIVEAVAVEVGDGDAGRRLHEGASLEMQADMAAELERHAIGVGELQIGDTVLDFGRRPRSLGIALAVMRAQPREGSLAPSSNLLRRIVDAEEVALVVFIERHQGRDPARHPRVTGQRAVLGLRQRQAALELDQGRGDRAGAKRIERECREAGIHRIEIYLRSLTVS